ncbi:MAG: restriction endonuclease [Cytophagales bacterium]|nr:restriction endonuclease [Cytophagales bacterium]
MPKIPSDILTNISATEFEKLIHSYLVDLGKTLSKFEATHDKKIPRHDGTYQIDVYAEFEVLGGQLKVLIECKMHNDKIKRDVVQLLHGKITSIGAHKGMIFATSEFQSGAIEYAKEHGIALIRVIEGKYIYITKSQGSHNFEPPPRANIPKFVGEYRDENSISYIQDDYLDPLKKVLFKE